MKFGYLSDLFLGAGAKYVTEVEVNPDVSRQSEFQGIDDFKAFLGSPSEKETIPATYLWLDDTEENDAPKIEASATWGDRRKNKVGRSSEFRLYYPAKSRPVVHRARAGDLLIISRKKNGSLLILLAPARSTTAQQLLWLFGLDLLAGEPQTREITPGDSLQLGLAARSILRGIGIEVPDDQPPAFDKLVSRFKRQFPPTAVFSEFARSSLTGIDPRESPDDALIAWMEHEEALFRHLEHEIVATRLKEGFKANEEADVDGFLSFSLSVHNRRKSRAGYAFAHHVEAVLKVHNIRYKREATTEKRNAADFLFPGEAAYCDPDFPDASLTMLAVKTTCKDRWRQVLAEANRIRPKHLLTLEPAISVTQTDEMQSQSLQLVVPSSVQGSYLPRQREWLIGVGDFLEIVRE